MKINPACLSEEQKKEIKKILIIQQKPFGDILLNTGYFPELRRHFPDAQIDYLIQRSFKTVLEDNPYLDNLILMDKAKGWRFFFPIIKAIRLVRKQKYDLVIDQLRGTSSARIAITSGAKYKLGHKLTPKKGFGFTFHRWNRFYNLGLPRGRVRYYGRFKFDLLKPLGIEEVEHNLFYHVKPESMDYIKKWLNESDLKKEEIIAFTPGTPVRMKQWDLDYYARLGDMIQKKLPYKIVILWGPGEKQDAEYIKSKMETKAIIAPPTTFNEAGAFLNFIKVLICNDGGINHLAVSQETPTIAVFGAKSAPDKWVAYHKAIHMYLKDWSHKDLQDNTFNISPEMVFQKLMDHLGNTTNKNLNELYYQELQRK